MSEPVSDPTTDELCFMSALELREAIRSRTVSPVEATEAVLAQIERVNPGVNAFVTLLADEALAAARDAEQRLVHDDVEQLGALHGIPIAVKDLTSTAGVRTTFGTLLFQDHVPTTDALAWSRIKAAGAILIGKTTTPEFGMRGITESTLTGVTRNPWNPEMTAGGSSGGSAVAAATGMAHLTWGSDGGGSIRIPAAYCGVVGLKASIGRIPLAGEDESISFASAVAVGPITRDVADCALLTGVTAGPSIYEPYGLPVPEFDFVEAAKVAAVEGLRVAYCPELAGARVAAEVREVVDAAAARFAELGAHVDDVKVDLPDPIEHFLTFWGPGTAAALDGELCEFEPPPPIAKLAEAGRQVTIAQYFEAQARRSVIARGFAQVFADYDLLLTPTSPVAPFPHPGDVGGNTDVDGVPVEWPMLDFHRLTEPFSHAGIPAVTVPCGFTSAGLPVGLQIGATYLRDDLVLRAAAAYEAATPWHEMRPSIAI